MNFQRKKQPKYLRRRAGFTMLEVVVAMAVGAVGVMAFIGLQLKSVEISEQSRNRANAAYIASEMADRMMSNSQDFLARRYYRGETGTYWNTVWSSPSWMNIYTYCTNSTPTSTTGCGVPAQVAIWDIYEVKQLAAAMLPNGRVHRKSCGVGNTFDCLVVTWGETISATCDPETNTSCYVMQLKVW